MNRCVLIIIINNGTRVFLQLRDEKPQIRYPGYWAVPGGEANQGELIYDAVEREFNEEIRLAKNAHLECRKSIKYVGCQENEFKAWEYYFCLFIEIIETNIKCLEGQRGAFFDLDSLPEKMPPHHKQILENFKFKMKQSIKKEI